MLQIVNLTKLASERALLTGLDGQHVLVVGIKGTWDLAADGTTALAEVQEPVALAPTHLNDDEGATRLRDRQLTLDHDGTDVIINGAAHAPGGRPATEVVVKVTVGRVTLAFKVVGDRTWQRGLTGVGPDDPQPFTTMPILYERAFGGGHPVDAAPGIRFDERNPAGCGYCTEPGRLVGTPVPNLEPLDDPIFRARSGAEREVIGLSARPGHWRPRRDLGGTYDAAWQKERLPFWPADTQTGFFRCAAPPLQLAKPLIGHETITLENMSPSGLLSFKVPRLVPTVRAKLGLTYIPMQAHLRRVIVEPDLGKLVLFWRAVLPCGLRGREIEKISVDQKRIVRPGAAVPV